MFGEGTAMMLFLGEDIMDEGRTCCCCILFSPNKPDGVWRGDKDVPLLRRRSADAAGLGGASAAQGAKGAGSGASSLGEDLLVAMFMSKGEYVGVGMRSMAERRLGVVDARFDSVSYVCRFSSVRFMRRTSSTTLPSLGRSCDAAAESRRRAPKFLKACGIVDQRFLVFFSGFVFSSGASKASKGLCTGVGGAAENAGGGGGENVGIDVETVDRIGVGGPTSSSPKRWYTMSFSMFSPETALRLLPDTCLGEFAG